MFSHVLLFPSWRSYIVESCKYNMRRQLRFKLTSLAKDIDMVSAHLDANSMNYTSACLRISLVQQHKPHTTHKKAEAHDNSQQYD